MSELEPEEVRTTQEVGRVRVTNAADEYCFAHQTVEALAAHVQASRGALQAAFRAHAAQNGCGPAEALLRRLSTHLALRFIHRFNEWNHHHRGPAQRHSLDLTWPALERWGGTHEILRFARRHAGPDWQAFARCVGRLKPEEFAYVLQRMEEFENGW